MWAACGLTCRLYVPLTQLRSDASQHTDPLRRPPLSRAAATNAAVDLYRRSPSRPPLDDPLLRRPRPLSRAATGR